VSREKRYLPVGNWTSEISKTTVFLSPRGHESLLARTQEPSSFFTCKRGLGEFKKSTFWSLRHPASHLFLHPASLTYLEFAFSMGYPGLSIFAFHPSTNKCKWSPKMTKKGVLEGRMRIKGSKKKTLQDKRNNSNLVQRFQSQKYTSYQRQGRKLRLCHFEPRWPPSHPLLKTIRYQTTLSLTI
jgi:hypothetical protein